MAQTRLSVPGKSMNIAPILILAALREEIASMPRIEGVEIAVTGDGPARAASGSRAAIDRTRPSFIIGIGVAGALSSDLRRDDIVASRRIIDGDGESFDINASVITIATAEGALAATLVTARAIATAAAKAELARNIAGTSAIDMESAAWHRAAAAGSVPFVSIRCILDAADEELPPFLGRSTRADGSISRTRVTAYALTHPREIRHLVDLRRRTAAAAARLAVFLPRFIARIRQS